MRSFELTDLRLELLPTHRPTEKKIRCDAKHVVLGKYGRLCVCVCVCVYAQYRWSVRCVARCYQTPSVRNSWCLDSIVRSERGTAECACVGESVA
jgi:hypothetical protein